MSLTDKPVYKENSFSDFSLQEQWFLTLVENSFDVMALLDREGLILQVSPSVEAILGYPPAQLAGRSLFDYVHPEHRSKAITVFGEANTQSGDPLPLLEFRFLKADDSWCFLELGATRLPEATEPGRFVINARDVTERSQVVRQYEENEIRFRRLLENARDIIVVFKADGRVSYVSPSVYTVLGYSPGSLIDKWLTSYIHPADNPKIVKTFTHLCRLPGKQVPLSEYRVRHSNGSWLYFEAVATNLLDDPLIQGIVVNGHDITVRKEAEIALQMQVEFATQIMNTMGQGLCVTNLEAGIEYVNPAYCRMVGYSLAEIMRKTPFDITPPEDIHFITEALNRRRNQEATTYDKRILRQDGSIVYVTITGAPRWRDGKVIGSVSVITDLTERRRVEEEQRRHNEYLNALHQTALDLMNRLELDDLLGAIIQRAGGLVRAVDGFVALAGPSEAAPMEIRVGLGQLANLKFKPVQKGDGLIGQVWESATPVVVANNQDWPEGEAAGIAQILKSAIGLPLISGQQVVGVIGLGRVAGGQPFSPEEVQILNRFAQLASIALDNAQLYTSVQRRLSELTIVQQVAKVINSNLKIEEIFQAVINRISQAFGYDLVSIFLLEGSQLVQQAQTGYEWLSEPFSLDRGVSGEVVRSGRTIFVKDAQNQPNFLFASPDIQQAIIIPLLSGQGQVLGTLAIESRRSDQLTEDDVRLLTLLADQVSVAVENGRLFVASARSEDKYREVINSVKEVIFQLDTHGHWTLLNPAWQLLSGYSVEESLNRLCLDYVYEPDRQKIYDLFIRLMKGMTSEYSQELRVLAKDGSIKWVEIFGRSLFDPGNAHLTGLTGILVDISNRKQAEEERLNLERKMLEAQRLESLGILTGGIAHDFNNLLTTILGNAELAQLRLGADNSQGWLLDTFHEIEKAATNVSELIRQLLIYSGKGQLRTQTVSLNSVVKEIIQLLRSSLVKHKARLECVFAEDLPEVAADINQVRQVVMNLVVNSSEAIGEKVGVIYLSTGQMWADQVLLQEAERWLGPGQVLPEGQYLYIEVKDTGCGMDAETLNHIFDPFYTTKFTGRGLGLSAVQGIVRAHRGALQIESEVGQGTTFRVLYPTLELSGLERLALEPGLIVTPAEPEL